MGGLDGKWGEKDLLLTLCLTLYRDGLCSCGKPLIVAHDPANEGWYEAKESVCHACAPTERHREEDKKPTPGAKVYPVYDPEGLRSEPAEPETE